MSGFDENDKGKHKRRRTSQDRFSFHMCFHGDAWLGVDELSGLATGVYWKLILRMYIKRAALLDDDEDLARLFNATLKEYRRAKKELLAHGRIVVEDGLIFDERALRELVGLERYSDVQTARIKKRWATKAEGKKPALRVVSNVAPVPPTSLQPLREVLANPLTKSDSSLPPTPEIIEESRYRGHTNPTSNNQNKSLRPTGAPRHTAQPPGGGRAPTDKAEWLERQRAALLGDDPKGIEEAPVIESAPEPDPPVTATAKRTTSKRAADRKARRT